MSMTSRYEERLLDWLEDGPAIAPGQVLDTVAASIPDIPQRHASRVPWRFTTMPMYAKVLLAAAVGTAVVAGALLLSNPSPPAPPPKPPAADPEPLWDTPWGSWHATRGAAFGLPAGDYGLDLFFGPVLFARGPHEQAVLLGEWAIDYGTFQVGATDHCSTEGSYEWSNSADGQSLTMSAVDDQCLDRRTVLEGDWDRAELTRTLVPETPYRVDLDRPVLFTVPAGFMFTWSGGPPIATVREGNRKYLLLDGEDFFVWLQTAGQSLNDRCDINLGMRPQLTSIDDFLAWNGSASGAKVSQPTETSVGGYPAVYQDITGTGSCPQTPAEANCFCMPVGAMLGDGFEERTWAVDLGDGQIVTIGFHDDNPPFVANTPERLAIAQKFVDSIQFPDS
jgi:hypothetical protein